MALAAPCLYLGAFVTLKPSLPRVLFAAPGEQAGGSTCVGGRARAGRRVAGAGPQVVPPTGSAPRAFMDPLRAAARP